jgi:hypothetical protein
MSAFFLGSLAAEKGAQPREYPNAVHDVYTTTYRSKRCCLYVNFDPLDASVQPGTALTASPT